MESTDAGETHTGMGKMRKSAMEVLVPPWFTPETERSLSPARGVRKVVGELDVEARVRFWNFQEFPEEPPKSTSFRLGSSEQTLIWAKILSQN